MRAFQFKQPALLAMFAAAAAAALIGSQQLHSTTQPTTSSDPSARAFAQLEAPKAVFQSALYMPAAVQSGTFEDMFVPAPPVVAPAPVSSVAAPADSAAPTAQVAAAPTASTPAATAVALVEPEQKMASVAEARPLVYESGVASTYGQGDGFEGQRDACGGIFRTGLVSVAHKSLPCGTIVRVEDVDTGKTVEAEVTDRGPYVAGRIVDLSGAAFTVLDPAGMGLLNVNLYVIDTSNQYLYRLR